MNIFSKVILTGGLVMSVTACTTSQPTINTGPDAFVSSDGLYEVDNTRLDVVMVDPAIDLGRYNRVFVQPVEVSYKRGSYELTEAQYKEMLVMFEEVLADALEEGGYTLTDKPGDDVLMARVKLIDFYVNIPTEPLHSLRSTREFTSESGEVTLIGELIDSESNEVIARFRDRSQPRTYWERTTAESAWWELKTVFNFWARTFRVRLDAFHGEEVVGL